MASYPALPRDSAPVSFIAISFRIVVQTSPPCVSFLTWQGAWIKPVTSPPDCKKRQWGMEVTPCKRAHVYQQGKSVQQARDYKMARSARALFCVVLNENVFSCILRHIKAPPLMLPNPLTCWSPVVAAYEISLKLFQVCPSQVMSFPWLGLQSTLESACRAPFHGRST